MRIELATVSVATAVVATLIVGLLLIQNATSAQLKRYGVPALKGLTLEMLLQDPVEL